MSLSFDTTVQPIDYCYSLPIKVIEGLRAICNFTHGVGPLCRISNAVFEYQPITPEIVTQLSRYKRADTNFVADGKGFQHLGQVHLYLYIYSLPESGNSNNERRGTENMFSRHKTQSHG